MSDERVSEVSKTSNDASIRQARKAEQQQKIARMEARQIESQEDAENAINNMPFSSRDLRRNFKPLEDRRRFETPKSNKSGEQKGAGAKEAAAIEKIAEDCYRRNPELQKKTLVSLYKEIKPDDSHEEILHKLQKIYTDKSLADEAIDFLIRVAENKEALKQKYIQIKQNFNAQFGREIQAGYNISTLARSFSEKKGLGSPTALRDLYREVTGNPRSPHKLFEELTQKFQFSDMKNIIDFILHSLGADMKAKGPSIPRAELQRLFEETRSMQAILGVFRFFFGRMKMIKNLFDKYDLTMPSRINFESLARLLMKFIQERYPSPDKVLKLSSPLGIAEEVAAQIVVFTQYRDAMRHISPRLFKSERHRQEALMALIETLSDLEDQFDAEEE